MSEPKRGGRGKKALARPRSHSEILKAFGMGLVAEKLQYVPYNTVVTWSVRNSIPGPYWWWLFKAGVCTLEELAQSAAARF